MTHSISLLLALAAPLAWSSTQGPQAHRHHRIHEYNFVLSLKGTTCVAQNTASGHLVNSSTDAGIVLQHALDKLPQEGGAVFIRAGSYMFSSSVNLPSNVLIRGHTDTVLRGPSLQTPLFRVSSITEDTRENVTLSTLHFADCNQKAIRIPGGENIRILDCRFTNINEEAILNVNEVLNGLFIERCEVLWAGKASASNLTNFPAINLFKVNDAHLIGNHVTESGSTGISVWSESGRVVISHNTSSDNDQNSVSGQGHGIIVGGNSSDILIDGNFAMRNGYNGIEAATGANQSLPSSNSRYAITNNTCVGNGTTQSGPNYGAGIFVSGTNIVVADNFCILGHGTGISIGYSIDFQRIRVHGNIIGNNNQAGATPSVHSAGIALTAFSGSSPPVFAFVDLHDNLIYHNGMGLSGHAIYLPDELDAEYVRVQHNRLIGFASPAIRCGPLNTNRVSGNDGFLTESSGIGILPQNSDRLTIPHSLEVTPDLTWIQLTPLSNLQPLPLFQGLTWWVESVGPTNFLVRTSGNVLMDFHFAWRMSRP